MTGAADKPLIEIPMWLAVEWGQERFVSLSGEILAATKRELGGDWVWELGRHDRIYRMVRPGHND